MYDILFNSTIGWVMYILLLIRSICFSVSTKPYLAILNDEKGLPSSDNMKIYNNGWFIFSILGIMIHIGLYTLIYLKIPNDVISILICIFMVYIIFSTSKKLNENYIKIKLFFITAREFVVPYSLTISTLITNVINITIGIIYILYIIYFIGQINGT